MTSTTAPHAINAVGPVQPKSLGGMPAGIPNAGDPERVLIRRKQVTAMVGLCDRTIYNLEQRGAFPRRKILSLRAVAWYKDEVQAWINARPTVSKTSD